MKASLVEYDRFAGSAAEQDVAQGRADQGFEVGIRTHVGERAVDGLESLLQGNEVHQGRPDLVRRRWCRRRTNWRAASRASRVSSRMVSCALGEPQ